MKKNKLRELLKSDTPTIGTRIYTVWPGVVELIGYCDEIDYVEFLGEYVSYTLHDLENIARAVELSDMSSLMKIDQENQAFVAKSRNYLSARCLIISDAYHPLSHLLNSRCLSSFCHMMPIILYP